MAKRKRPAFTQEFKAHHCEPAEAPEVEPGDGVALDELEEECPAPADHDRKPCPGAQQQSAG